MPRAILTFSSLLIFLLVAATISLAQSPEVHKGLGSDVDTSNESEGLESRRPDISGEIDLPDIGRDYDIKVRRIYGRLKKQDFCIQVDWPDGCSCVYCDGDRWGCVCSGQR